MIIGNGLLAKAFEIYRDNPSILIYASGVSNSKEYDKKAFEREKELLKQSIEKFGDLIFVYFSTTSIYDQELYTSPYVQHKLEIESIIRYSLKNYYIFRLPEVVGFSQNRNTITNFLYYSIIHKFPFEIWKNACRRIIDVEDIAKIAIKIIGEKQHINKIINITTDKKTEIVDLVSIFEKYSKCKSNAKEIERGNCYDIKQNSQEVIIQFSTDSLYNDRLIHKYYFADI